MFKNNEDQETNYFRQNEIQQQPNLQVQNESC